MLQYDDATLGNDKLEFRKVHSLSQITKARLEDIDLLPVAANADERYRNNQILLFVCFMTCYEMRRHYIMFNLLTVYKRMCTLF